MNLIDTLHYSAPHRPNPVGVTLARLDHIETTHKVTSLFLSGVDLVDGTPVVDIKPFVPTYDSTDNCRIPDWVAGGLALKRNVTFSDQANEQLSLILQSDGKALQFYGRDKESFEQALMNTRACIEEVLSVDVRSQWQTGKARKGKYQAERAHRLNMCTPTSKGDVTAGCQSTGECSQQLDNLLIRYQVKQANSQDLQRQTSQGSGAEDFIVVNSIALIGRK
jgi:hypothetical protein